MDPSGPSILVPMFTPSHLGKWENLYRDLVEGERISLTPQGTWMLADKPGLVCVFDDEEIVYLAGCSSISRTIQAWIKGGSSNELRVMIATVELGVSPKSAIARVKTNSISKRVDKITLRLKFRVIPVPPTLLESLASAFLAIADPRYNGQTSLANLAIDALPK